MKGRLTPPQHIPPSVLTASGPRFEPQSTISCRHSCQWEGDLRQLLRDRHRSTRFGNEEPSGLQTEPVEAPYVAAWLSLVERPVRDRKVAGSNPVAPTITRSSPAKPRETIRPPRVRLNHPQKNGALKKFEDFREAGAVSMPIRAAHSMCYPGALAGAIVAIRRHVGPGLLVVTRAAHN